ncbi:MAG: hypothetical protein HY360_23995 [Verrucomicrobia bacterium]|nr:hypothetical protein [Verrucomicrobiota bacterium]
MKSTLLGLCLVLVASSARGQLAPIETAASDASGRILVNGKPFFPIMLYDAPMNLAALQALRAAGFNTVATTKPEEADLAFGAGMYAIMHGTTKTEKTDKILLSAGLDSPALAFKDGLLDKVKADLQTVHGNVPNRMAMYVIGYWDNEPAGVKANTVLPKEKYDDLVQVIDVASPYLYPVPYQPIASVGEAVSRAKAAGGGKQPVLPFLQTFVWDAKDRYPTSAELKCMVYLSLIHGANGFGYYAYGYVAGKTNTTIDKEQPELWNAVRAANAEATVIASYLADGADDAGVKLMDGAPDIKLRAIRHAGGGVLLLANTSVSNRTVNVQVPAAGSSLKRLDGGKEVPVSAGKATMELQASEAVGLQY